MRPNRRPVFLLLALLLWAAAPKGAGALPGRATAAGVPPRSSALALTPDGATLVVVNPDSSSVSLVDTAAGAVIAELPVGVDPRSVAIAPDGTTAYVANQGADSVTVIDLVVPGIRADIAVGDRPVGVAVSPDGRFVAVAELGTDRVRFLSARRSTTLAVLSVGGRPSGLAFTPDGRRLLVTHLLSGDVTMLPVRPFVLYLPALIRAVVGGGAAAAAPSAGVETVPTWPQVAPAPAVVIDKAGTRAYLPQTMANGAGLNTRFDTTVFPRVSVVDLTSGTHAAAELISLPETDQPVGLPWDAALARDDTELWVVHAASNDLSVVDLANPQMPTLKAHLPVQDNPRGIVLSPDGRTAYVNNTLAGTVSVVDAQAYTVTRVLTVTEIPLPPVLLHGKRLFHSSVPPELSQARWIACATCHIEGEHDGRTWLIQYTGEVPPGATAVITRNTTGLLGMVETYPLRWSAEWDESADSEFSVRFEQFGAGLIDGVMHPTLGPPNQGRSYDLDCLAAFIDSLAVPAPRHGPDLTPAEVRGRAIFAAPATGCATCHPAPLYTDLLTHDVGTADRPGEWFGPAIDTPTLRLVYDSAPYLHDGSAATLYDVLTTANPDDRHGVTSHLTEAQLADLVAFLEALPYAP